MILINGMTTTSEGGVYLIKKYDYYTYGQTVNGCACVNVTGHTTGYTSTGMYVLPYKNTNPYYSIDTTAGNSENCLNLTNISMGDWFETYVNILVTDGGYVGGYTSGNTIEERIIYDGYSSSPTYGNYYYLNHTFNYTGTTSEFLAIIDPISGNMWDGVGNYSYNEIDNCGDETGYKIVEITDINPNSDTYNQTSYIYTCVIAPIVKTGAITNITTTTAIGGGNVIDGGSSQVNESGLCWSTSSSPTILSPTTSSTIGLTGPFTYKMDGLTSNTTYYVRAYSTNNTDTSYGIQKTFKTN